MKVYRIKTYYYGEELVGVQYTRDEELVKALEENSFSLGSDFDIVIEELELKEGLKVEYSSSGVKR